ncbi:Brp/Blh family beta-carotene 15,15'-dioxygenase [Sphingomonas sp. 35-24ZXX]|uniref:Brp/Blh family beta-carotene 15,15'-dioxygenase n=1 Tax=Sphingomonas sp. 35-24ZXX TaxID=1545915 RepID=UPI0009DDFBAB|nr:Brp/Blh family beta-carotene 15,15'-dioxygenase [Sphingomonas sp. 35-24ZXX]
MASAAFPSSPSPSRLGTGTVGWMLMITAMAIAVYSAGLLPETGQAIAVLSATLMVVGMPHGSFDIALLQNGSADDPAAPRRSTLIGLYLVCALAMYLLWQAAPAWGLGIFLLMAAVHFSEDWQRCGSRFIATGMALAFLSAPSLLHSASLASLFAVLSNDAAARLLVDVMVLIAPTMLMLAIAGAGMLWHAGERNRALSAVCGLAAMLVLPPVHGFALFFCLVHSPIQFGDHSRALGLHGLRQWGGTVIPLTLGGLGIAVAIFALNRGAVITQDVFAASFVALSVLTAPHMLVPVILRLMVRPGLKRGVRLRPRPGSSGDA